MRKFYTLLLVAVSVGLLIAVPHAAAKTLAGENPTVAAGETVNDDLFVAGEQVLIEGTVNGDVYAAGDSVTVRGTINGDLIAAGSNITILGKVRDDVRVAAENLQLVDAEVGDSVSALAQSINSSDGSIGGGLLMASQNVTIRTPVGRGIMAAAESLTIANSVGRDVRTSVGQLNLLDGAAVAGTVNYHSEEEAEIAENVTIGGDINQHRPESTSKSQESAFPLKIWGFLSALLVGAIILWLMPGPFKRVSGTITRRPLTTMAWGAVALILTPVLIIVLIITFIGIPLALITTGIYILFLYLAKIFATFAAGKVMFEYFNFKYKNPFLILAVSLFLYYVLLLIPVVGWLVRLAVLLTGLGAAATCLLTRSHAPKKSTKTATPAKKKA